MKAHSSIEEARRAAAHGARLARFAAVGLSGVLVNLAALHLFAGLLDVPEIAASAYGIEASLLSNFALNDRFTFRDRRGGAGWPGRLLRYHAVSLVGVAIQLGSFTVAALAARRFLGRAELGALRYPAQLAGIGLAFGWSYLASFRFAWAAPADAARPVDPAEGGAAPAPSQARAAIAVFFALLVLHVLPIWLVAWFPTQDGPLHVENVLALLGHDRSPLLQHWYLANWGAQPNWLTQALLAPLLAVTSPVAAEKVVLTGYTILLPLSFRAVLPRGARGWWAALAVFPFVHAFPFHMGFWNFCYGLALAFLVVGFWLRGRGRLAGWRFPVLGLLSVLLYLAHSVAFAGALVAVGAVLLVRAAISLRRAAGNPARRRRVLRGHALRAAAVALAALPGLALLAAWLLAHRDRVSARLPLPELAAKLATAYALVSIDRREIVLAVAVALVLFVGVVHQLLARAARAGGLRLRPHDGWLAAALAFVILYFAVPDVVAAGAHVSDRLALLAFLSAAAWIGGGAAPAMRRAAGALAAIAVVALVVRLDKQRQLSALVGEFVSARQAVAADSVLLPLALSPYGPRDVHGRRLGYRVKPFLHAAGWIVAELGGVDLKNSQANTDHCPVRWPRDRNPFHTIAASLGRMEGVPPCVDLGAAPSLGGIDYVLVWGATRENLRTPCGAALALALSERFVPVYLSEPAGMLQVWRPRGTTLAALR
jgi:putative flippase GtrA